MHALYLWKRRNLGRKLERIIKSGFFLKKRLGDKNQGNLVEGGG